MATDGANGYDAVVIGGGHNGLVAAAYLGKAGLRTVVLERRETLGGAAITSELAPGVRVPTLAHTVGRLRPSVVRDLDLKRHGLSLVGPDVRVFAPNLDGKAVVLWGDAGPDRRGPARRHRPPTPSRYAAFDRLVRSLAGFLGEIAGQTPPDIESPGLADALAGLKLGRTFRGLGPARRPDDHPRPADGRRRLRGRIVRDRRAPGGDRLARHPVHRDGPVVGRHDRGAARRFGRQRRGRGRPDGVRAGRAGRAGRRRSSAAAREAGVEIRTGAEVVAITSRDGRATGVVLADGDELSARAVVAGIDPKRTLTRARRPGRDRAQPAAGEPATSGRRARSSKVNLALSALPSFAAAAGDPRLLRGRIVIAPGHRRHGTGPRRRPSTAGCPSTPIMEATIPSLADPTLVDGAPRWQPGHERHRPAPRRTTLRGRIVGRAA